MSNAPEKRRDEMLRINREQERFYNKGVGSSISHQGNSVTRFWRILRRKQQQFRSDLGLEKELYRKHQEWIGPLDGLRVLDLGSYTGNQLSDRLAEGSAYYLAVDLSKEAMAKRDKNLKAKGLEHAEAVAMDVLSDAFRERAKGSFDLIYAHSVLHHFKHLDLILDDMRLWMRPGGRIVSLDPLRSSWPVALARMLYRPFQSDRAWEHPFGKNQLRTISERCQVEEWHGMMGWVKWAFPLYLLNASMGLAAARTLVTLDNRNARHVPPRFHRYMQLSMLLRFTPRDRRD